MTSSLIFILKWTGFWRSSLYDLLCQWLGWQFTGGSKLIAWRFTSFESLNEMENVTCTTVWESHFLQICFFLRKFGNRRWILFQIVWRISNHFWMFEKPSLLFFGHFRKWWFLMIFKNDDLLTDFSFEQK